MSNKKEKAPAPTGVESGNAKQRTTILHRNTAGVNASEHGHKSATSENTRGAALLARMQHRPIEIPDPSTKKELREHAAIISEDVRNDDELLPDGRPEIHAGNQDIAEASRESWAALSVANRPPRMFNRGGIPMRMTADGELQMLTADRLHHEIERAAFWYHAGTGKYSGIKIKAKAPRTVVSDMLAFPEIPLPPLRKIVGAPCFDADRRLCATAGYHDSGIYLTVQPSLPELPSPGDAVRMIDDVIADFPFQDEADRANYFAFLLAPVVRDLIEGPTPAHLLEAQVHGTGKTLLAELGFEISTGGRYEQTTPSHDEDELRKRITSLLMGGAGAIMIDNLEEMVSSTVASALTSTKWSDRILGKSEIITIPNTVIFALSGNNITLSGEIARRIVRIRLQANDDKPWERSGFRHPNIKTYVREHRAALQAGVISLVQSWIEAGEPDGPAVPFGSFESYSKVIGGILHHAGINGFMENRAALFEEADTEGSAWRAFTAAWYESRGTAESTTGDLFPIAIDTEGLILDGKNEKSMRTSLGMKLSKYRDRVFGEYRIKRAGKRSRATTWRLDHLSREPMNLYEPSPPQSESKNDSEVGPEGTPRYIRYTNNDETLDIF